MSKSQEVAEAIAELKEILKPGDTIYTTLNHVSRSGMSRVIGVYVLKNNEPLQLSWSVAKALKWGFNYTHNGVKVSGAGMDMGFHLVYTLSSVLFPDGFDCIGENCPSNDHRNGDRDYTPRHHRDGGYALNQRWL